MKQKDKVKFEKLRVDFLPEALEIVEKPSAPLGNIIIWFVFFMLLLFCLWMGFGKIDEVSTARGQLVQGVGVQPIQAAESGTIIKVHITEGQSVKKGQLIYSLDKDVEKSNIEYSEDEKGLLELKLNLLNQLLCNKDISGYSKTEYTPEQLEVVDALVSIEKTNKVTIDTCEIAVEFAKKQLENTKDNVQVNRDTDQYLQEKKNVFDKANKVKSQADIELDGLKESYAYAKKQEEKYKKLWNAGAIAKTDWEKSKQEVSSLQQQIEAKRFEIESLKYEKENSKNDMEYQFVENHADEISKQGNIESMQSNYENALAELEHAKKQREETFMEQKEQCISKLKEYGVNLKELYHTYEKKDIVAPYDGVIKTLIVDKEGSVLTTSQTVAEILPKEEKWIVNAEISNQDIGFVKVGQPVEIKVDTYDYQKYGQLKGTVSYISPDATTKETGEKIYKANVVINQKNQPSFELSQGMQCSIDITTNRKRIMDFFLEPLTDALHSSLKER